jgi:chromosome segregation ATPase
MSTAQVLEAEGALARAKAEARRAAVEDAKKKLKQLRAEAKELKRELADIAKEVEEYNITVAKLRGELNRVNAAIAQLGAPSSDPLDDPADHEKDLAALRAYHAEIIGELKAAEKLDARRARGIEIGHTLTHLHSVANNLLNIIEHDGQLVAGWEGGVSGVR